MEHFYKTRKLVVCVLFIIALALVALATDARATYIDLKGGDIVAQPEGCRYNGSVYLCVTVEKDGKRYVVMLDKKGEAHIFSVTKGVGSLIWSRGTV